MRGARVKLLECVPAVGGCGDIVRLYAQPRRCQCGKSSGRYVDDGMVQLTGPCRALGIDTGELRRWMHGTWHESTRVVRDG